jgi:glycosyltransferase involved in cell wall biosynthesis
MSRAHVAIDGMLVRRGTAGVETATYGLAKALASHGRLRYTLFLPERSTMPDVAGDAIRTVRCRIPCGSRLLRILHQHVVLPGLVRRCGCGLVHCPGYLAPATKRTPILLTLYDLIAFTHPELCRRATVINYRAQLPAALRRARLVAVPSQYTAETVRARFPQVADRLRLVPLAIDPDFTPECATPDEGARIREKHRLPDRFILFVGQIEPKKNVPGLLQAYCELRREGECRQDLVIAGSRGWEAQDPLDLAKRLGVAESVCLPGFVPREDLPALYRAADLFAFPSFCEGFGLPPLEAMACGTPVVVSNGGSLPEVVPASTPKIDPGDHGALAKAMGQLLVSQEARARTTAEGLRFARDFSWERHVAAMDELYLETAEATVNGGED